jgi:hypothetical protein
MQRFGVLLSFTTLAIPVTLTTTVMIDRDLAMSCPLKKTVSMTVPYVVRSVLCS